MSTDFIPLDRNSVAEIAAYQDSALCQLLQYLSANSPFYKEQFSQLGFDIAEIKTTADLHRLPFTTKTDLQLRNWDFLCVPRNQVAEYCSTSGTLGQPVHICLTKNDLDRLAYNEYRSMLCADGTPDDVYQLLLTLDRQFMAGVAYYAGILKSGAGVIRIGPGNMMAQLDAIVNLKPTVLVAVPSFVVALRKYASEQGITLETSSVKRIICIGESIRNADLSPNALAQKITDGWDVKLCSTYASTEKQTAFTECSHGQGGHHQPELIIFEIVDEAGKQVDSGEPGELVITTLGVEGMPLLRYKTGDICAYFDEPCPCGRSTKRLGPIMGRKQQLIKYKGTTLYPQAIYNVLNSIPEVADYVLEVSSSELKTDELHINLAVNESSANTLAAIKQTLRARLRVLPELRVMALPEITAMQTAGNKRKASRFIDHRNSQMG